MIHIFFNDLSENLIQCLFYEILAAVTLGAHPSNTFVCCSGAFKQVNLANLAEQA
jgi:hypothetical protein